MPTAIPLAPGVAAVPPFGATVDGVRALIPEAVIPDEAPPRSKLVVSGQVVVWLADLSRRVSLRLAGWEALRLVQTDAEALLGLAAPRERLAAYARDLVHNGAASYTESARHPERAQDGYAAVLWTRFLDGLGELRLWMAAELEAQTPGIGGEASFPLASFTPERLRF